MDLREYIAGLGAETIAKYGGVEQILKDLRGFEESTRFVEEHRAELLAQYPSQWIIVLGGEVRGAANTYEELKQHLERLGPSATHTVVEFLDPNPMPWILCAA